jgi:hypothetical protein
MIGGVIAGRQVLGVPWAVAFVPILLIGVVAFALLGRASDSSVGARSTPSTSSVPSATATTQGQISDAFGHSWQRPYAVTPDMDQWPTGFLRLAPGGLDFGPEPGRAASRSDVTAAGPDSLVVTATAETQGCAVGDVGAYRWSVEGQGTVLTLTAIGADACAARQTALAGPWVRSDLQVPGAGEPTLAPGTYLTSAFDPSNMPGLAGQLSYTVPVGWKVLEDAPASLAFLYLPDASQGQGSTDWFVFALAQPRIATDPEKGASCGPASAAPGVGRRVEDIVAAITARPGLLSTPPAAVTIGGYDGQLLDLRLDPSWTGGCQAPEGLIVGMPILVGAESGTGPTVGISADHPLRLILLDLTGGRTMSIALVNPGSSEASQFDVQVEAMMPVIESFRFHAPTP